MASISAPRPVLYLGAKPIRPKLLRIRPKRGAGHRQRQSKWALCNAISDCALGNLRCRITETRLGHKYVCWTDFGGCMSVFSMRFGSSLRLVTAALSLLVASSVINLASAQPLPRYNVAASVPPAQMEALEAERRAMLARILANPADLDANFAYAMLSARLGDLEAAIATFERMRIYAPDVPRLRLELGSLYARLGAHETARQHFLAVKARPDTPAEVRANIDMALANLGSASAGPRLSGQVTLGALYSSNANSGPNERFVTLNGFQARLDDVAIGTADASGGISGGVQLSQPLGNEGHRIEASLSGRLDSFANRNDVSAGAIDLRVGALMRLDRLGLDNATASLSALAGTSWLGGEPNLHQVGLSASLDIPFSQATLISANYTLRYEDYLVSAVRPRADLRDGLRHRASLAVYHSLSSDWQVMAGINLTRKDAVAASQAYWEPGVQAGLSYRFTPDGGAEGPWTFTLATAASLRNSDGPDPMVNAAEAQKGVELSVQATQSIPLRDQLSLQLSAGYRHVFSNYDTRTHGAASVGASLSYSF